MKIESWARAAISETDVTIHLIYAIRNKYLK